MPAALAAPRIGNAQAAKPLRFVHDGDLFMLDPVVSSYPIMNHAFMETAVKDLGVMLPIMVAVILLAMCLLLRSVLATISALPVARSIA